jgi:DNA polymerase-3 subunit delta
MAIGQWQQALGANSLAPVYLLAGAPLLVLEAADALRARAKALGYSEREVLEVGQHFDWNDLARAAAGMSLFASRRLLDLRLPTGRAVVGEIAQPRLVR